MKTISVAMLGVAGITGGALLSAVPAFALSAQKAASEYGTRPPVTCPDIHAAKYGPPPAAMVKLLVKCDWEHEIYNALMLMDGVRVQVGSPIPWHSSIMAADADSRFPFYPIRGSFVSVMCKREFPWSKNRGRNCEIQHITHDEGYCWHTGFGDWKCGFGGENLRQDAAVKGQPPTPGTAAH